MNYSEAALAITLASTYDNRSVGEAPAAAWAEAMPDLRFEDVKRAIVEHYTDSTEWLMPAHIRRIISRHRREALSRTDTPVPPRELADSPRAEARWIQAYRYAILDGHDSDGARSAANRHLGINPALEAPSDRPSGDLRSILAGIADTKHVDHQPRKATA